MSRELKRRSYEFLGVDQKVWLDAEVGGFGDDAVTGLIPPAGGAVDFITCDIKFDIPREDSPSRSGRSVVARLSGKKTVDVKVEAHIIPGTPDGFGNPTLPPMHPLILSAFGDVDLSNPAEIKYKLSRFNGNSTRILEEATHYSRIAVGCIADKLSFTLPGDGKAQMSMEGFAQDAYIAGESNLVAATIAGNDISVTVGHGFRFELDSYVDVIDGTDGNTVIASARKVTAVVGDLVTLDGAPFSASIGDFAIGHAPGTYAPITSEYALLGLKGTFNVAGFAIGDCELISAEIGLTNNYTKKDFLYGTDKICGFIPDKRREVSVKLEVLLNKDTLSFYMRNKQFVAEELTITLEPQRIPGPAFTSSVGRTWEFYLPKVEFNIPPIANEADAYVTLSLEGKALAPSANQLDEEFTLTIK
jgi:hypothetical protein